MTAGTSESGAAAATDDWAYGIDHDLLYIIIGLLSALILLIVIYSVWSYRKVTAALTFFGVCVIGCAD